MTHIPEGWKRNPNASYGIVEYVHESGLARIWKLKNTSGPRSKMRPWNLYLHSRPYWDNTTRHVTLRDAAATHELES